jgi:hypothetical protein
MIYTLRFDQAALHLIGEALGQMPHRTVAALIGNIQSQINAQEVAASSAAAPSRAAAKAEAAVEQASDAIPTTKQASTE